MLVRAYAYVNADGTLDKGRSKGFVAARKAGEGNYCLTLRRGIDPAKSVWSATIVQGSVLADELLTAYASPQTCAGRDIGVRTGRFLLGKGGPRDAAFVVVLP